MIWQLIARFLAWPRVADWLLRRAERTPYDHLAICKGRVQRRKPGWVLGSDSHWYMRRFRLLRIGPLQIRLHNILAEDPGRHRHSHPWPFRTFILRGWYLEQRGDIGGFRLSGSSFAMGRDDFHRITQISDGGAWTLFCTWGPRRGWGFRVNGETVPHDDY